MSPLCQALSNALEMSKKIPLTFMGGLSLNDFCISCVILKKCEVQELPGRKAHFL